MKILNCIFVIIGIIIGAGFASGKEIYTFFYIYGIKGIIGIIISMSIITYIIYKSLKIINKYNIETYNQLLAKVIIKREESKINIKLILNFIINTFLLISFFVMCAGFSAYFRQEFGINQIYSNIAIAIFSYIILSKNIKGIFLLNSILIPGIIISLVILGIKEFGTIGEIHEITDTCMWLPKAILYASYNCITLIALLIPMKKYIKSQKDILKISLTVGIIITILAVIIIILLLNIQADISKIDLPAVYASRIVRKSI